MKLKYTVVIDENLHEWFAHQAIDAKSNISALVAEAMSAYRQAKEACDQVNTPSKFKLGKSGLESSIPEAQPKPYLKKIYHPNTKKLNDTPEARKVSKTAATIVSLLKKAKHPGLPPREIESVLERSDIGLRIRRDALAYLKDNNVILRKRDCWVHADFAQGRFTGARSTKTDSIMQG